MIGFGDWPNAFRQEFLVESVLIAMFFDFEHGLEGFCDLASFLVKFDTPHTSNNTPTTN